jgi:Co/Zn/Cd efflux system component
VGYDVMSTHVTTSCATREERDGLLRALREIASAEFSIAHVTIQLEDSPDGCRESHHIAHAR